MNNFHDFPWAQEELSRARSKKNGRPLANNTRLFERGEDSIAVKLHATDVVTINADGTWTLASGGWNTSTTMQRIRGYSPARLFSERGEWFVSLEPDPNDPAPERYERTVPKPYTASDPGPYPIKTDEGCQAGTMIGTDHVDEIVDLTFRKDMREGDELVSVDRESSTASEYDSVKVKRTWTSWVFYGESSHSYGNEEWNAIADKTDTTYEQCPHCKAFAAEHERWRIGMHGARWGVRFDQQSGYATYSKMMEQFGSQEAWQEAYIADYRARREYTKARKEWDERNRVPFFDGITVDESGYAKRKRKRGPSAAKLKRHEAKVAKMKKQIDTYVKGFVAELKKGTMPMPSGGDCWYCCLSQDGGRTPMGDSMPTLYEDGTVKNQPAPEHLLDHMKERYYVPSLAVNALRERGYKDIGIAIHLDMDFDTQTMGNPNGRYDGVKRDITKYLSKRVIPNAPTK